MKPLFVLHYTTQLGATGLLGDGRMPFTATTAAPLEDLATAQRQKQIGQALQPNTYDVCELVPVNTLAELRFKAAKWDTFAEDCRDHTTADHAHRVHNLAYAAHSLARDAEAAGYHVEITRKPLQPFAQGHALTHVEIWPTTAARHAAEQAARNGKH